MKYIWKNWCGGGRGILAVEHSALRKPAEVG